MNLRPSECRTLTAEAMSWEPKTMNFKDLTPRPNGFRLKPFGWIIPKLPTTNTASLSIGSEIPLHEHCWRRPIRSLCWPKTTAAIFTKHHIWIGATRLNGETRNSSWHSKNYTSRRKNAPIFQNQSTPGNILTAINGLITSRQLKEKTATTTKHNLTTGQLLTLKEKKFR